MEKYDDFDEFLYSVWNFYEANLSERTRRNYYNVVKGYIKLVGHTPLILTDNDVNKYYLYLENRLKRGQLSYSTVQMRISVMKSLCEYIRHRENSNGKEYINYFNNIILPDKDKTITEEQLPDIEELNALLELVRYKADETAYMIFSLILKCGLTASEISSLDFEFLAADKNNNLYINLPARRKISRIIKLPDDISRIFAQYLDNCNRISGAIFLNHRGTRIKVRDAERLLKKYIQEGIELGNIKHSFTMQDMRLCAVKYMLLGGADSDKVADYTGITTRWMSRYRRLVAAADTLNSADYSIIHIK